MRAIPTRRERALREIAETIVAVERGHPLRVALDGRDAAGKTTLADELEAPIRALGRPVIRASVDHFHNPRSVRYSRGRDSAEGYYLDSFDDDALIEGLLRPLGPGADRRIRTAAFDLTTDSPVQAPVQRAAPNAIVLVDGIFLLRPCLRRFWDYVILVEVDPGTSLHRALLRDRELLGGADGVRERYERRYLPAHELYRRDCTPAESAHLILDNTDPADPKLTTRRSA